MVFTTDSQIMKIAFLGKGGSGKSTMATAFAKKLHERGFLVLAIDADHNMDLSYNLGAEPSLFLGSDPDLIKEYVGARRAGTYGEALKVAIDKGVDFKLSPVDKYTEVVTIEPQTGLRLMVAGPHTDRVRKQEACSHSLAAPLKVYLPRLKLAPKEVVIIDERAGTDPVATGILAGVDLAVIVREPTVNSRRVAEQIGRELSLAGIKYVVVDNKESGVEADTEHAFKSVFENL